MAERQPIPSESPPLRVVDWSEGDPDIEQFLNEYPDVRPYVSEAINRLARIAGSEAKARVWIQRAIDDPDDPVLVVDLPSSLEPQEALEAVGRFDAEWWIHQPPEIQTRVIIDLDLA